LFGNDRIDPQGEGEKQFLEILGFREIIDDKLAFTGFIIHPDQSV
jgi:hypothetical protein